MTVREDGHSAFMNVCVHLFLDLTKKIKALLLLPL